MSYWHLIWVGMHDITMILLTFSAIISISLGVYTEGWETGWFDGSAIIIAILVCLNVSAINDLQKDKQFRILNAANNRMMVTTIRNGEKCLISTDDLVVGDIIQISAGDTVPADCYYLNGSNVKMDESKLTGESDQVDKNEVKNPFLVSSTECHEGSCTALIVAVGQHSVFGHMRAMIESEGETYTPLQVKLAKLAKQLSLLGCFMGIITMIFIIGMHLYHFFIGEGTVDENGNVKLVSVDAWAGTVHIYGVTYSGEAGRDLVSAIKHAKIDADVKALTISNDYASDTSGSTSKFVSVATGFYKGDDGTLANFEIQQGGAGTVGSIPRMSLKRLAAKIDIQWDAADAYPNYTDVKVTGFTFDGGASVTGSGSGRLFPELNASSTNKLMGNKTFVNTSEISQRNGRVYHYVSPDGVSTPKVTFNISANDNGGNDSKDYSLNFSKTLSPATWYKVNATIKGVTGDGSIDVFNVNDSGQ